MRTQILTILLVICFSNKFRAYNLAVSTYDACGAVTLTASTGIKTNEMPYTGNIIDSSYISSVDTMTLSLSASSCMYINVYSITVNGEPKPYVINYYSIGPRVIKMLSYPGHYVLNTSAGSKPATLWFDLILNPVGLIQENMESSGITLFPNPTDNEISINSLNEELESVTICAVTGKNLKTLPLCGRNSVLSIESLQPGLYYLYVATKSKRITIRKLTIL